LPNGQEYPNDRGIRIHDDAEKVIRREQSITRELKPFEEDFYALQDIYEDGDAIVEELWCFDEDWNIVQPINGKHQWHKHWARIKIDTLAFIEPGHAVTIDYKTGKRVGNEIKHGDQIMIYAIAVLLLYPEVEHVTVELWYIDQEEIETKTYTREQAMRFLPRIERRGVTTTTDTQFEPDPSKHNCRFCPYKTGLIGKLGPEGTGHCSENLKVEKK